MEETTGIREEVLRWLDPDVLIAEFESYDPLKVMGRSRRNNECPIRNLLHTKLITTNSNVVDTEVDTQFACVRTRFGSRVKVELPGNIKACIEYVDVEIADLNVLNITAGEMVVALQATKGTGTST